MENMPHLANTVNLIIVQSPRCSMTVSKQKPILPSSAKRSHGVTPPLKPAKKLRKEETEIVRCKRRLDFARLGLNLQRPHPAQVARRNERERNRVKLINNTFASLREHLPDNVNGLEKSKKMSKVDTLKAAIDYIQGLQDLLDDHDAITTAQDAMSASFMNISSSSPCFPGTMKLPVTINTTMEHCHVPISSPSSTCSMESSPISEAPFSPEEEELFDFASWFQWVIMYQHRPPIQSVMVSISLITFSDVHSRNKNCHASFSNDILNGNFRFFFPLWMARKLFLSV